MNEIMSVSNLMVMMKAVKERMNDLKTVRTEVSKKERFYSSTEKEIIPQYDVKLVDAQIVKLQNWIMKADAIVKQSNAVTMINIEVNLDELMKPLS